MKKIQWKCFSITNGVFLQTIFEKYEEWDVSEIDNNKKGEILLSNSKFSKILENILQNDVNLNVILNDNDIGIVYKNNKKKYEPMTNKDIIEKSMNKVYKHLKDFYNEIIKNNNLLILQRIYQVCYVQIKNYFQKRTEAICKFVVIFFPENTIYKKMTALFL